MLTVTQGIVSPSSFELIAANSTQNSSISLRVAFSVLSEMFDQRITENGYNIFISAINGISIAKAKACSDLSTIDTLRLIQEFQADFQDLSHLRSIFGKLLCINSTVPVTFNTTQVRRLPINNCNASSCDCPRGGISTGIISCSCQFFNCLALEFNFNTLRQILGFASNSSRQKRRCLAFVMDTTGSMGSIIHVVQRVVLEFVTGTGNSEFDCYVLIPFNDVGDPERSM